MLANIGYLRDINMLSVSVRMVLAVICGGLIGIEREIKRRPAGFRTHILICLGAAMTTLTSQYLLINRKMYTDIARLGAQAIVGIGFIGAGTIITTQHRGVKGLTTAAGLWVSAIVGLACGAGFYEGAVLATVITFVAEVCLSRVEHKMINSLSAVNVFIEYESQSVLDTIVIYLNRNNVKILNMEVVRKENCDALSNYVIFYLQFSSSFTLAEATRYLRKLEGVRSLLEL